jgi:hypothetical protein
MSVQEIAFVDNHRGCLAGLIRLHGLMLVTLDCECESVFFIAKGVVLEDFLETIEKLAATPCLLGL